MNKGPLPHVLVFVLKLRIFRPFSKKSASTRFVFESFLAVNTKTQQWLKTYHLWWEHAHLLVSEPNLSYLMHRIDWIQQSDVIVFKTSVFIHPHEYSTTAFSKISALERVFWEDAWIGDGFHRLIVWATTQTGKKTLRFQIKKDTCWRGLISISHKKYIQTLSKTDTFVATGTKCPSKSNVRLNI